MVFDRSAGQLAFASCTALYKAGRRQVWEERQVLSKGTDTEAKVPGCGCYERGLVMLNSSQLSPLLPTMLVVSLKQYGNVIVGRKRLAAPALGAVTTYVLMPSP